MNDRVDPQTERRGVPGRGLTNRQSQVLGLVAEGLENKEIGHRLGLSEQAVKEHVSALLRRLSVRNRAALAEIATELKIAGTTDLRPEWLSYIYQQSQVMSAVVRGPDHVFVSANEAFRRAAGDDEIIGRPFIDVFPANPHGVPILDEVAATRQPKVIHEIPGRWLRSTAIDDGYADVSLQPLPGPEAAISIAVVDVTEQVRHRKAQTELSPERLALLDLVPSGVVVLDARGAVLKVNRAAQSLLGGGPYAITGRDLPPVEVALASALRGEPVHDLRVRIFLPALGRDAAVRIDAEPVRAAQGEIRGVVASINEVAQESLPA